MPNCKRDYGRHDQDQLGKNGYVRPDRLFRGSDFYDLGAVSKMPTNQVSAKTLVFVSKTKRRKKDTYALIHYFVVQICTIWEQFRRYATNSSISQDTGRREQDRETSNWIGMGKQGKT